MGILLGSERKKEGKKKRKKRQDTGIELPSLEVVCSRGPIELLAFVGVVIVLFIGSKNEFVIAPNASSVNIICVPEQLTTG